MGRKVWKTLQEGEEMLASFYNRLDGRTEELIRFEYFIDSKTVLLSQEDIIGERWYFEVVAYNKRKGTWVLTDFFATKIDDRNFIKL